MKHGYRGLAVKNERIESLLNILYDFRFNTVKSRTEYRAADSSTLYSPLPKFVLKLVQAQAGCDRCVLSPLPRTSVPYWKRFRKKGTSHTGILQRPALTESCRTRAYRQAPEHGTGSQPRQNGRNISRNAYRCGSQRHEDTGFRTYLFVLTGDRQGSSNRGCWTTFARHRLRTTCSPER